MAVPPRDPRPFRAPGGFPAGAKWIQPALVQSFSVAGCICLGKERNDRPGTGPVRPPEQRDAAPILSPALCVVRPECSGHAGRSLGTVLAKRRKRLPRGAFFLGLHSIVRTGCVHPGKDGSLVQRELSANADCGIGGVFRTRTLPGFMRCSARVLRPCRKEPGYSLAKRRKRLPGGAFFLGLHSIARVGCVHPGKGSFASGGSPQPPLWRGGPTAVQGGL